MIQEHEDTLSNFREVIHVCSGDKYRIHVSDSDKVGTDSKVSVYEKDPVDFVKPNSTYPNGLYRSRLKFFVASFLAWPTP